MKLTLNIDASCVKDMQRDNPGKNIGAVLLEAIKKDPGWWLRAADSVTVQGAFGTHTEVR